MSSVDYKKVNAIAQNVNFVTRFENGLQNLLAVLDKTSVTKLPAGAAFITVVLLLEAEQLQRLLTRSTETLLLSKIFRRRVMR